MQSKRFVATEVPFFVTCCSGFDARDLLPPFPPDLRPDDTVFMWFLKTFDRHGLVGHLPVMVQHDLGPRRPDRYRPPGDAEISLSEIVTDIVAEVVNSSLPNQGSVGLVETGRRIRELAGLSPPDWTDYVHKVWVRSRGSTAVGLERFLDQYNESPDYWAQDVSQYIAALRSSPPNVVEEYRQRFVCLQRYIDNLGELLLWWPTIWNAASSLERSDG